MKGINQWRTEAGGRLLAGALEKRSRFLQASEPSKISCKIVCRSIIICTKVASSEVAAKGMYLLHTRTAVCLLLFTYRMSPPEGLVRVRRC